MSFEKADVFIRRLKEDIVFRDSISGINDYQTMKTLLLCEKLIFNELDLIHAVTSEAMRRERAITIITQGWKFLVK